MTLVTAPPRRVPVEHRRAGLDKRTFPYALFVIAVFLVSTVVVPGINHVIQWQRPALAGEQVALTDTIALTPATGWDVQTGHRLGEGGQSGAAGAVTLVGDGVTFTVVPGPFDGTPAQLLQRIDQVTSAAGDPGFAAAAQPVSVTTPAGYLGVVQTYSSVDGDGLIGAFVIDGTGLAITAYGPPPQMSAAAASVSQMIASIRTYEPNGSAS